jgi:hypothetical protein
MPEIITLPPEHDKRKNSEISSQAARQACVTLEAGANRTITAAAP